MHTLMDWLGAYGGQATDLWGGFLSCLGYVSILGTLWHGVNCHERGCWRPGHHVGGTVACHRHRPH